MKQRFAKWAPKLFVVLLYAAFYLISYLTGIGCIWKYLFGIPCPGCGFTRAVVSAIRLDFAAAFAYHPMVWSFPFIVYYFLFADRMKRKINDYLMIAVIVGFLVCWIYRISTDFIV